MNDLFGKEQRILDNAVNYLEKMSDSAVCDRCTYEALIDEYRKLLRQLRSFTKISDKTTNDLNASKLDLLDKVHFDALTGIYSRRYMEETLNRIVTSLSRSHGILSVLMIDVDCFKKYNDTYGHSTGDECLKSVAAALNRSIRRPNDFLARYGGEEMVVILPDTNERGALVMAERMLENVKTLAIPHENNAAAEHVTISIGGAAGIVLRDQSGGDYIRLADKALYISKQSGRNQYTFMKFEEDAS